ncbi:MAG: universal stress protein [Nitrospira sp.]|nr:universal stress protein [Nitrospira sp.]MCP9440954.1 universal stress protein [Nitrospira sp.]
MADRSVPAPSVQAATLFQRIVHPTDFSIDSHTALLHAVKLALVAQADLSVMHVDPEVARDDFENFPRVSPILKRWKVLKPDAGEEDVAQSGLTVKKVRAVAKNPTEALLQHLSSHPADLLIMATHQYDGLDRWQHHAVAEPVARGSHVPTLFIPTHVEGFVSKETGTVSLRRVLIPVHEQPNPQAAVDLTAQLASMLGCDRVTGLLIHVGRHETMPDLTYPMRQGLVWRSMMCHGNTVDVILGMGEDFDVDLIVMVTSGHDSLLDMLRGSTTERVLRGARCPLLAIPATH